jgi:hypothetical protein
VSGSGEIELTARERLGAAISGSGGVRYHGDPATDVDVSGSGEVTRA